jgi:hypothetical protein
MGKIVAVVTAVREEVAGGGAPVFSAENPAAAERMAQELEKALDCAACLIGGKHYVLVERSPDSR